MLPESLLLELVMPNVFCSGTLFLVPKSVAHHQVGLEGNNGPELP